MPTLYSSLRELGDACGFVVAPFTVGKDLPVLLLRPDIVRQCSPHEVMEMQDLSFHLGSGELPLRPASREDYHEDFCRFHRSFSASGLQKLVLARCADVNHSAISPALLFERACWQYSDAFVALISAPQCGTWLIATPEVLLAQDHDRWRTMALAGTMSYADQLPQWSVKNVQEQAYVAQYIKECLDRCSNDVAMQGPYTTRAGNLVHLRTDFSFTLADHTRVGDVLDVLHPTPAVCGLPKQEAQHFISENESCNRGYYSGFSGPMNLDGCTAMFVSLRCMRIFDDRFRLYAGGGILPQSEETMEWDETSAKMQAMLSLIN